MGSGEPRAWRADTDDLVFGVVSGDPLARTSLARVCEALAAVTGRKFRPEILESYGRLAERTEANAIQLAWAPPLVAHRLMKRRLAVAVSCPRRQGGLSYHSVLFVRAVGRLKTLADLRGARAAWVDPVSLSGSVLAQRWCRRQGFEPERLFSSETNLNTHSEVARAVLSGTADVGATYANIDPKSARVVDAGWSEIGASNDDVRVIVAIGPVPADAIVVTPHVPNAVREGCVRALTSLGGSAIAGGRALFRAERFEPAPSDYLEKLDGLMG